MSRGPFRHPTWSRWRRVRQAVQIVCLVFFVYLALAALPRRTAFPLADLFFRFDPLGGLAAFLAGGWQPRLALGLVTMGLTLVLGRVWCGWICPLGTLLDWFRLGRGRAHGADSRFPSRAGRWRPVKYLLLAAILAMALFGSLTLLVLDPLALLTRATTIVILPGLFHAITAGLAALYPIRPLQGIVGGVEALLRGPVIPVKQPVFSGGVLVAALFAGVVALNGLADRFWCRCLCPLGGLLALLSRVSLLRPDFGPVCSGCSACGRVCPTDAVVETEGDVEPQAGKAAGVEVAARPRHHRSVVAAECVMCMDCLAACPQPDAGLAPVWRGEKAAGLARHNTAAGRRQGYSNAQAPLPSRRQFLAALGAGAGGVLLARTGARAAQPDRFLLRPPGVAGEADFLARCLRCGECIRVCPTVGLQPAAFQAGLEGVWTPCLTPRLGYCDYGCNACGQVCPSQAIPALPIEEKRRQVMGRAVIDRNRCLPWADGVPCIVCEEMCPVAPKAIRLERVDTTDALGQLVPLLRPHVVGQRCIGCGVCEYQCPLPGEAAIRVRRL